jgi:hypothetical protein
LSKKPSASNARLSTAMGRPIAAVLSPLLNKPAAKRGFRDARLMAEWSEIVGSALAAHTRPERLERRGNLGTLRLVVAPGWALEVQHLEPLILQRINLFFGASIVTRLALRQGRVDAPMLKAAPKGAGQDLPSPAASQTLAAACENVEDPELAAILRRLGQRVLG